MGNDFELDSFFDDIKREIKEEAFNDTYDYECPECEENILIRVGKNKCPHCGQVINLNPDNTWDNL